MKLHIIVHESFEAPAALADWAASRHHDIEYTRLYLNQSLPEDVDAFDFLVVMGGPQSPATTPAECAYFAAGKEIALIRKAVARGKLVLGICLGAQLLGEAFGAGFAPSPNREIGVFALSLTESGRKDPVFSTFPEQFMVGHWHGDMPGLTAAAEVLACSAGCPRQVIRYTPRVYGFQCHFEFTPAAIEVMIEHCAAELEKYKSLPYVQDASALRNSRYEEMNAYLFRFLDYLESLQ
ncbi:MAG: gamma-glutamyl-gamma-aminobutyrate hydrolase family protein [Deltaproteobacteria bacterium]|nr:gamma-glutamyl-gamma-aminobutyrate hydrolase family protein [Deltaproteobacteria bacterium]